MNGYLDSDDEGVSEKTIPQQRNEVGMDDPLTIIISQHSTAADPIAGDDIDLLAPAWTIDSTRSLSERRPSKHRHQATAGLLNHVRPVREDH